MPVAGALVGWAALIGIFYVRFLGYAPFPVWPRYAALVIAPIGVVSAGIVLVEGHRIYVYNRRFGHLAVMVLFAAATVALFGLLLADDSLIVPVGAVMLTAAIWFARSDYAAKVYERVEKPLVLPLGEANGCADLKVLGVEAGPTVLADGIEKDLALVVAPSITLPCASDAEGGGGLPPLANVTTLQGGPFTVTMPIAATYHRIRP